MNRVVRVETDIRVRSRSRSDLDRPRRRLVQLAHEGFDAAGRSGAVLCRSRLVLTAGPR